MGSLFFCPMTTNILDQQQVFAEAYVLGNGNATHVRPKSDARARLSPALPDSVFPG